MSDEPVTVSNDRVLELLRTTYARLGFGSAKRLAENAHSGDLARRVVNVLRAQLRAEHPLNGPATGLLEAVVEEARALESLRNTKPAMKHARAIEEATVTLEFLIAQP